ncbi:MAG: hypothetical protein AB7N24_10220 [Dehalococcoidia bacterium]
MALESNHVPPEVIRAMLCSAGAASWRSLHEAAHRELEREGGPRFEENVLNDVVAVGRLKQNEGADFPIDFDSLVTEMNRAAKAVPHR